MSNFMLMEPMNQSFQEIIGNGVQYTVPRFQRDYAWNQAQWEELWADIETLSQEDFHYMGYIVLQKKHHNAFEVIDGQQRLITLTLIALASMKKIKQLTEQNTENETRLKALNEKFVGYTSTVSLRVNNKLTLNRNNNEHFRYICDHLDIRNTRGLITTNKLLNKAFKFFEDQKVGETGSEIAKFIENIAAKMFFTKIVVQDSLNAYKVFETLNARGVQLSTPDLLKNYIFYVITQNQAITSSELDDFDKTWAFILQELGLSSFTDFIRYHYNFQNKIVTKKDLFLSIRNALDTSKKAVQYLKSLEEYAPIYAALSQPASEYWRNIENIDHRSIKFYLTGFDLFNIKQPFTVLMAAANNKFSTQAFEKLLKYFFILTIRYNVICHLSPNEQEKAYNRIAMGIHNNEYKTAYEVKNSAVFKNLYPNDDVFLRNFEFHKMPSKQTPRKIRFLLSSIENYLGNAIDYEKVTLEHICPYHADEDWDDYFGEGVIDVIDRLGNMVLLKKDHLGRKRFDEKKEYYAQSGFKLADKVASYENWDKNSVDDYQRWLAKQAAQTWHINFD